MLKFVRGTLIAGAMVFAGSTAAMAQVQTLSFSGTLTSGNNNAGGPFGAANTNLAGQSYSVVLSYNPSQFVTSNFSINSCGPNAGTSCSFQFSPTRTLTETLTVNGTTIVNIATAGSLNLNSAGNDSVNFSFQNSSGLSFSGQVTDGNALFPNQSNVNNPTFSNFTNLAVTNGGFNQSGPNYNLGASPTTLSANFIAASTSTSAVPEPTTWAMMIIGFGAIGGTMRRRQKVQVSFA
jgi:hypothetical protein